MIDSTEVRNRARELEVSERVVEKDYVLTHLLVSTADRAADNFVFRGGTALSKVYWPDFRLSEDLDFLCTASSQDVRTWLSESVEVATARTGLELRLDFGDARDGWARSLVAWDGNEVIVDVNLRERVYLEAKRERPLTPYSDLNESDATLLVVALAEILGNKWYMLGDRNEPRDLYDLWSGLGRGVAFSDIAMGHTAKYGFAPTKDVLTRLERLRDLWDVRLSHQVGELPEFDGVVEEIARAFRAWRDSA